MILRSRYELRDNLSGSPEWRQGGTGVVYRAWDTLMQREVAVKTLGGGERLPASLVHLNIVEIYDSGDFKDEGVLKLYFVMPLLKGSTLRQLIEGSSQRLTVERSVDIIYQACQGLQAAHEVGILHRNLNPDAIFVQDEGPVKILGFGLVPDDKGMLPYMAPELVRMEPPTPLTDIFALGAVCNEMLIPRLASEIDKGVSQLLGRVVQKALAMQPERRFSSAREFGETLRKALRNEPIELYEASKARTRIERAGRAFERGEYQMAGEILGDLESEGYTDPEISDLRRRIEQAARQAGIRQLLKSAQQFFDEEEYTLALRKIHEALALDPRDAAALELEGQVETRLGEQKSLQNNALDSARNAVVELKPNDVAWQQKSAAYDEAVQAWQRGDVTTALSSLERWAEIEGSAPDTDTTRLAACRSFYNQVRSEHEAIGNAYEDARRKLAERDFAGALALCDAYLAKYPSHAQFQALKSEAMKSDAEDRLRQADAEPDPGKCCGMLEAALRQYPGDPQFESALRLVKEKLDLVNPVIAKARQHEDQGRFTDAMDQWEILRAIHGQYPGIDNEIARLKARRDSQPRAGASAAWMQQVDRRLEARDYAGALEAVRKGLVEFPDDPELTALGKLARSRMEAAEKAMTLLAAGQEDYAQGRQDEGLAAMRRAHAADDGNTVIREILADALAVRARALIETDWAAADRLVGEILDLDPDHALGKNLRSIILDKKREEFVSWCTGEARRLQAAGDPDGARAVVQQGLASYPQEPRLTQLLAALADPAAVQPPTPPPPPQSRPPGAPTVADKPVPVLPAPKPAPVQPASQNTGPLLMGAIAAAVLIILAAGLFRFLHGRKEAPAGAVHVEFRTSPPGALIKVDGAAKGSSDMALDLPAGTHAITAELEGYQPAAASIEVKPGAPAAVNLALTPFPGLLRIYSDTPGGEAWLDRQKLNAVQEGAFGVDSLAPGDHSVQFSSKDGQVALTLALDTGRMPALTAPIEAKGLQLALVDQSGSHAQFSCNCLPAKVGLDNQPPVDLTATGLEWNDLTPGTHEFVLNDGKGDRRLVIQTGPASSVTAFVFSKPAPDAGVLIVSAGEDKVSVYINNRLYRSVTGVGSNQAGQLRIPNLPVAKYTVRVAKDGFEAPPEQTVSIAKGAETKLEFHLKAISHVATLQLQGAPAGTKVLVDGNALGTVQPDGGFQSPLAPGVHAIELQKDAAKSKPVSRRFAEGQTTLIAGADLVFEKLPGTLRFKVTPPNSHITVRLQSEPESQARAIGQESVPLPEGSYIVSASAPEYLNGTAAVTLAAGGNAVAEIALKRIPAPPPAPQTLGMSNWEAPAEWTKDGSWFVHKGGNFVPFKASPVDGTFAFTIGLRKGKRLQWAINRTSDKDYTLYRLDKKYLYRDQVINGKTTELAKVEHHLDKEAWYTVKIDVSADKIVTSLRRGENWLVADTWSQPGKGFDKGKFGFIIPGKDEFAVNAFSFYPPAK